MENNSSIERAPYVKYLIEGNIDDKGIGYTVKKSVGTFLKSHNYEGKVTLVESNSSRFTCTLELYDNGKEDFNVRELKHHLDISGKLPTKNNLRPEVSIKPLPYNLPSIQSEMGEGNSSKNFDAYQKTIEELNSRNSEKDASLQNLTDILNESQKTNIEKDKKIKTLESRLEKAQPRQYSTAKDAVLNSHISRGLETLLELSQGISDLDKIASREYFEKTSGNIGNFVSYVSSLYGIEINSEAEIKKIAKRIEQTPSWEETPEHKENAKAYLGFEANKKILNIAQESGATPDVVEILSEKVRLNQEEIEKRKSSEEKRRNKFIKEKELVSNLNNLRSNYESLERIHEAAKERETLGTTLPILARITRGETQKISFSTSLVEKTDPYQNHLINRTFSNLNDVKGVQTSNRVSEDFLVWEANFPQEFSSEEIDKKIRECIDLIKKDELTRALGVTPTISLLEEI